MNQAISSKSTYLYKYFLPPILTIAFVIECYSFFSEMKHSGIIPESLPILILLIIFMIFSYVVCIRLKKIEVDQSSVYIYGHRKEDILRLSEIKSVGGSVFWLPDFAWIKFCRSTKFGSIVFFLPESRFFPGFSLHPIVEELRGLVKRIA